MLGPIGGPLLEHALAYGGHGLHVFPVNPRDKTPLVSQHLASTARNLIADWWERWPEALIGHRLPKSTVVTDIDPRHHGDDTWRALKAAVGELPSTRAHASGRGDGGLHVWWERPDGKLNIRGLNEWARAHDVGEPHGQRWGSGIDLLHHDHRYTILPPSPHPDTGAPYRWVDGRGLQVEPAPMPALLVELLVEPEQVTPPPLPRATDPDSIADWFTDTTTWAEILEPHGWTRVGGDGEHDGSQWRHPAATSPVSATVKHGCLFVYSPNTPLEPTEAGDAHGYTRFRAWATLEHAGDLSAAARAARERHGWEAPPRIDVHALVGQGTVAQEGDAATAQDDLPTIGDSWRRTDLAEIIDGLVDGTLQRPLPTLGRFAGADDGLFYRGRVNGLYGEPNKGKTWVALAIVAEVLDDGGAVGWIDLEEPAAGIVGRLLDIGVPGAVIAERFAHFAPEETIRHAAAMQEALDELGPDLVVIDSTGEALALEGYGPNNDDEVATWFRHWPRWLAARPSAPGVVVIDHVVKDEHSRGLWPGGSQRKKAAINGAAFMATPIRELGRGVEGRLKLVTSKDRHGHHRPGTKAGEFVLDARSAERTTWRLERDEQRAEGDPFRPTVLMERVSTYLEELGEPATGRAIEQAVTGKGAHIRTALARLVDEGFVSAVIEGRLHHYTSVSPFRQLDEIIGHQGSETT